MGTNFYLLTKDREARDKWVGPNSYCLTDVPEWAYEIHIAKTSYGWLPLFQSHRNINCVSQIKQAYDTGCFSIVDEYGKYYSWPEFQERVIDFGKNDNDARSHVASECGMYYFADHEGYEFTDREFC